MYTNRNNSNNNIYIKIFQFNLSKILTLFQEKPLKKEKKKKSQYHFTNHLYLLIFVSVS